MLQLWFGLCVLEMIAYASSSDCIPSSGHIKCTCNGSSIVCSGVQQEIMDVQQILSDISSLPSSDYIESLVIDIENITLNPHFSFKNIKIENLTFSSGLQNLKTGMFSDMGSSLINLNLQNNAFSSVPSDTINQLANLHYLILSNNNIAKIATNDFSSLKDLKGLHLSSNDVVEIEGNAFTSLPNLKELFLDYNQIQDIDPNIFHDLKSLELLNIAGNKIHVLDSLVLENLPGIRTLVLDKNNISSFWNMDIESFTLQKLSASNCSIEDNLETDLFSRLPELQYADFSCNNIVEVKPFALSKLSKLNFLNLSNNAIKSLHNNAFLGLYNLIDLDLKDNDISVVGTTAFLNLTKLRTLDLSSNNLVALLCDYTSDLLSLEKIHLQNNKIKMVGTGTFMYSHHLKELKMKDNVLDCTCALSDFVGYLNNSVMLKGEDFYSIKCASPASSVGSSVFEINFETMNCPVITPCESSALIEANSDDYDEDYDMTTEKSAIAITSTTDHESTTDASVTNNTQTDTSSTIFSTLLHTASHTTLEKVTQAPTTQSYSTMIVTHTTPLLVLEPKIDVKNYSLLNNNFCIDWSIDADVGSKSFRCLMTYVYDSGRASTFIQCPKVRNSSHHQCLNIRAANSILELCIKVYDNSPTNHVAKLCATLQNDSTTTVIDTTIFTVEVNTSTEESTETTQSSSTSFMLTTFNENGTVVGNESESIFTTIPSSTTEMFQTFDTTQSTLAGGSPITTQSSSSVTTQSSSLVTTESSSPITTLPSSSVTTLSSLPVTTQSSSLITTQSSSPITTEFSSPITTTSSPLITTLSTSPVTTQSSSPVTAHSSSSPTTLLSSPVTTQFSLPVTQSSLPVTQSSLFVTTQSDSPLTNELTLSTNISANATEVPNTVPFNITHFDIYFKNAESAVVQWEVTKNESKIECHLKLVLVSNPIHDETTFNCANNSYVMTDLNEREMYRICLTSYHRLHGSYTLCRDSSDQSYEFGASKSSSSGLQTFPLVILICLLVIVIVLMVVIVMRSLYRKQLISERYDVSGEEKRFSHRKASSSGQEQSIRYSYTASENI